MERHFKGVWIPKEIWLNEDLGWTEKLLLVEIDSLAKNGECFASNEYFAKFFGLSKDRISKMITKLNRANLVSVELIYKQGTKQIEKRIIRVKPIGENADTPRQKHLDPLGENADTPLGENAYDNNTYINNTINNTVNKGSKDPSPAEINREFDELWQLYPRKIGRKKAFDSFKKARKIKKIPFETIQNGLYRYIKYLEAQGTDEQFIMHGSTWFNQEKWQDEYTYQTLNRKPKNALEMYHMEFGGKENEFRGSAQIIDCF